MPVLQPFAEHPLTGQQSGEQVDLPRLGLGRQQGFGDMPEVEGLILQPQKPSSEDVRTPSSLVGNPMKPSSEDSQSPSSQADVEAFISEDARPSPKEGGDENLGISPDAIITTPIHEKEAAPESIGAPFLEVVFDAKWSERRVQIFKKPLGADFKQASGSTKVAKVHAQSYAGQLGLQVGWTIKSISGQDVIKKTFRQIQDAIKSGLMPLPAQV